MPWSSSGFRRSCSSPGADRATVRSNTPAPFRSPKTVPLNYRPMGKTELEVSEVGFPLWPVASGAWGSFSDEQAMDLLRKAYDAGINYFDVAPTDGNGRGESLLGKTFQDRRELVIISSKVGRAEGRPDFSPGAIKAAPRCGSTTSAASRPTTISWKRSRVGSFSRSRWRSTRAW